MLQTRAFTMLNKLADGEVPVLEQVRQCAPEGPAELRQPGRIAKLLRCRHRRRGEADRLSRGLRWPHEGRSMQKVGFITADSYAAAKNSSA